MGGWGWGSLVLCQFRLKTRFHSPPARPTSLTTIITTFVSESGYQPKALLCPLCFYWSCTDATIVRLTTIANPVPRSPGCAQACPACHSHQDRRGCKASPSPQHLAGTSDTTTNDFIVQPSSLMDLVQPDLQFIGSFVLVVMVVAFRRMPWWHSQRVDVAMFI